MRIAFIFPGQGSQYVGMGQELAQNFVEAAEVFGEVNEAAGYDLSDLCFFPDEEERLNQTVYAQPAILATSLACLAVARKFNLEPVMLAGLSLGEYTALVAAGSLTVKEALPLIQHRARCMQEAVPLGSGLMYAILGLEYEQVENICQEAGGKVVIANYNSPNQVVIAGLTDDVMEAARLLKEAGARTSKVAMSVPSHSPLMVEAARRLRPELEKVAWKKMAVPVISNVTARPHEGNIIDLLERQLYSPVCWEQSVRYMMDKIDYFVEIGPGSSLSGLVKKVAKNQVLGNIDNFRSLEKILEKVN